MKKTLILAGLLALSVAGCGRMADLESPIDGGPSNPFGANPAANDPR